ncbi:MAG: SRPBCC family protein [Candidatus Acidiferrum sp.]
MTYAETLKITTPTDREILITRVFNAPRRLVFEAWTNPEYVPHWMLGPEGWTMPVCEIDFRPGGSWHFIWRHSKGEQMEMRGVYREINPPERVTYTESWGGDWPETLDTLALSEESGKTTASLTLLYPSKEARDKGLKSGMEEGMKPTFDRLEKLLPSMQISSSAKEGKQP